VKLGRSTIPVLEAVKSDDPEVRSRIAQAISRIQKMDPFFLVRPLERRVSVSFKDLPFTEAYARVFSGFAVPPNLDIVFIRKDKISLSLEGASYWEAVEKFASAAGVYLQQSLERPCFKEHGPGATFGHFGRFMVQARTYPGTILVSLHPEPGLSPVSVSFKLTQVSDDAGVSLLDRIKADARSNETPVLSATLAKLTAAPEALRGKKVNILGTASIELATDIEAVEFRRNEEKMLSQWSLTMDIRPLEGDFDFRLIMKELKGWKAPEERSYLAKAWVIVADDDGRTRVAGRMAYGGGGEHAVRGAWEHPGKATRICVLRPTAVERVEIPVQLRGIVVPD
jgi:hypothetical protein